MCSFAAHPQHNFYVETAHIIVIHQVYELWFKQLLHERDHLAVMLRAGESASAARTLRRTLTILKTIVAQVDVLETMTPLEFGAFRGHFADDPTAVARAGWPVPAHVQSRDVTVALAPDPEVQAVLIAVYRAGGEAANVAERLLDLDEGMQEWRYRHVKMVERTIGAKMGTGGSPGAGYLATTLKPCFPDLWAIRSSL